MITQRLIKSFKLNNYINKNINIKLLNSSKPINNINNKSIYNKRLFSTNQPSSQPPSENDNKNNNNDNDKHKDENININIVNNNNNNNNNNSSNNNNNNNNNIDIEEEMKGLNETEKEKVYEFQKHTNDKEAIKMYINIIKKDNEKLKQGDYSNLTEEQKEEKRKEIIEEISKLGEEDNNVDAKKDNENEEYKENEEEDDDDDESEEEEYDEFPIGTTKTPLIIEDNVKNDTHTIVYRALELTIIDGKDSFIEGIRSIFSFFGFYSSYIPSRNSPLINPFFHFCKNQCNYLFKKNPFFIIMFHRINSRLLFSELHSRVQDVPIPSIINKDEFLEESSKALKQLFKLAEAEKSLELQKITCIPATPNLLSLRDVYFSINKETGLDFSVEDVSIDNFDFDPIDCKAYDGPDNNHLKIEATYKITSNKYSEQCLEYPVICRANFITQLDLDDPRSDDIDWKVFGVEFMTEYDPK